MDTTFKPGRTINVAYTETAAATGAVSKTTTKIMIWCSTDAFIKVGSNPTATTSDMPITGKVPMFFDCTPEDKVSAIQQGSNGTVYVTEMSKT